MLYILVINTLNNYHTNINNVFPPFYFIKPNGRPKNFNYKL